MIIRSAVLTQITGVTSNSDGPDFDGPGFDDPSFDESPMLTVAFAVALPWKWKYITGTLKI